MKKENKLLMQRIKVIDNEEKHDNNIKLKDRKISFNYLDENIIKVKYDLKDNFKVSILLLIKYDYIIDLFFCFINKIIEVYIQINICIEGNFKYIKLIRFIKINYLHLIKKSKNKVNL